MLENLSKRFETLLNKIRGRGVLTEQNIDEALREVRLALLEADVHFKIVKSFIDDVRKAAVGKEVLASLTPGQALVKIVWQELCQLMGTESSGISFPVAPSANPTKVMLVGLQGNGKTTTAAKLARFYKQKGKQVLLVAADLKRPAACEQLQTLGNEIGVPVMMPRLGEDVFSVIYTALETAKQQAIDLLIIDTAGRVAVDEAEMEEIRQMKSRFSPEEVLLVSDAMAGQNAVSVATHFHETVGLTGVILTKTEGDARGGAILSVRAVTGAPIKFIGTGEKVDALALFHPDRIASKILGMGDILSLVEMAEKSFSLEQATELQEKVRTDQLTLEDFRDQLKQIKKMGSMTKILEMLPKGAGIPNLGSPDQIEKELRYTEAIISSMTSIERNNPDIINGSRRIRIANGSGTSVQEVNRFLKKFFDAKKMFKAMSARGGFSGFKKPLKQMFSLG